MANGQPITDVMLQMVQFKKSLNLTIEVVDTKSILGTIMNSIYSCSVWCEKVCYNKS